MNTRATDIGGEPPEGALTAAEYVLGVLDAARRRSAETRLQRDPAFAGEVDAWERRLAPLIDEIVPIPVPFALWPRIQAAVGIASSSASRSVEYPASFWQRLGLWRMLAASGFAAAAASLFALFLVMHEPMPRTTAREFVATMTREDGKTLFTATIDAATGRLVVVPIMVDIPADRVAELWLIPPGDAPHSLGLVDPHHARPIVVPAALRTALGAKALVAVSLEPPGGAPHGQPTGPIIAKGEIALL
jgi:anti-sigma-K factor RskA